MTHSGNFCFFVNFSRKSVKILVHSGIYNPAFVCQHARRGLFFQKKHFGQKSYIYLLKKLDAGGKPSTWFPPEGLLEHMSLYLPEA